MCFILQPGPVQVVLDEPATVHYIGLLQSRDQGPPSSSAVYSWLGLNGLQPDFNGTINATQAGVPFSSGQAQLNGLGGCLHLVLGEGPHSCTIIAQDSGLAGQPLSGQGLAQLQLHAGGSVGFVFKACMPDIVGHCAELRIATAALLQPA